MPNVLFIQHEEEDRPGLVGESFAKLGYNVYLEALATLSQRTFQF